MWDRRRFDGWRRPADRMVDARRRSKPRPALISGRHDTRSSGFHTARNGPATLATAVARGRARPARVAVIARPGAAGRAIVRSGSDAIPACGCRAASSTRMRHGDPHDPLLRQVLPLDDEDRIVPGFGLDAVGDSCRACRQRRDPQIPRPRPARRHRLLRDPLPILLPSALPVCGGNRGRWRLERRDRPDRGGCLDRRSDPVRWRSAVAGDIQARRTHRCTGRDPAPQAPAHPHAPADRASRACRCCVVWPGCARCRGRSRSWSTPTTPTSSMRRSMPHWRSLRDAGATLLNQAVLLRGVNDSVDALGRPERAQFRCRRAAVLPASARSRRRCRPFRSRRRQGTQPARGTCGSPVGLPGATTGARSRRRSRQARVVAALASLPIGRRRAHHVITAARRTECRTEPTPHCA